MNELESSFNKLKNALHDYETRSQQIVMAKEVMVCMEKQDRLMIEAGTGVGKSFAYLIPAILSGQKIIISTASIALQNQLIHKDLVFLKKTLPYDFSFTLLKGKNNYLCLKRERTFAPELGSSYTMFSEWALRTKTGEKDELLSIPDFWSQVCCDSNDCAVGMCPYFKRCFYYRHYRTLSTHTLLVVNHHLLIQDILSEFNLLPFHEQLIIDEAHHLEQVISSVFGNMLNYSRILWLLHRLKGLQIPIDHLFTRLDTFFKQSNMPSQTTSPIPEKIIEELKNLKNLLSLDNMVSVLMTIQKKSSGNEDIKDRAETTMNYIHLLDADINDFIGQGNRNKIYYAENNGRWLELKSNLVESHTAFAHLVSGYSTLIMTSATLTTGNNFDFIKKRLGITNFKETIVGSPFNYQKQTLLYIEKELPPPDKKNTEAFQQQSLEVIQKLINASKGRALILFTSYSHLHRVSKNLTINYPFKSQGDMPPGKLIDWFKGTKNSVLLATATFWQGIDIKGDSLSLVVITKLPFPSPGDPVYDERCKRLRNRWFPDLSLPSAILLLKQGIGRLIRGNTDYGVIAILDTRLVKSSYGNTVLSSLPAMTVVHTADEVKNFFYSIHGLSESSPA